jgi:hypothetical protein
VSTVFTLFLVPALFSLTMEAQLGVRWLFGKSLARGPRISGQRPVLAHENYTETVGDPPALAESTAVPPYKPEIPEPHALPAQLELDDLILDDHKAPTHGHTANPFIANGNEGANGNGTHHGNGWPAGTSQPEQPM